MIIKDRKTSTDLELTHIAIHNILKLVDISLPSIFEIQIFLRRQKECWRQSNFCQTRRQNYYLLRQNALYLVSQAYMVLGGTRYGSHFIPPYRRIGILLILWKVFEWCSCDQIYYRPGSIHSKIQFGFKKSFRTQYFLNTFWSV